MFSDYVSPTGRQLQDGETLGQYEIGPSTLFYFGTSINLDFTLNALVEEETVAIKLYSDSDCTQDITDSDYLVPELIFDQDFVQNSTSVRPMRVQLTINEGQIKTSPVWQERDDQFFIFFCTKVSLYTGNVTDPGAVEISILETLSQIKVDLVGGFGVDVNVSPNNATAEEANQVYFVEGFLCDDTLQKVTYDRPRTQGSTLRVCVKPTDAALADGLKMRAVDSFSFYRDQVGSVQITQEALARGESANPSLTTLICVRGTELCYFDTLLKAEFFYGAGNVQGFGEAWLQVRVMFIQLAADRVWPSNQLTKCPFLIACSSDLGNIGVWKYEVEAYRQNHPEEWRVVLLARPLSILTFLLFRREKTANPSMKQKSMNATGRIRRSYR